MNKSRAGFVLGLLGMALCVTSEARAQTKEELDQARRDFQDGVALSAANNCAAAVGKFQAVLKVKRTAQVLFNIAECEERLGKLVSSLGNYRLAAASAEGDKKAKDVANKVGPRITELEGRIPKLVIRRGSGAETATIVLDGTELGAAEISGEIPVDPGSHVVVGKVGDRQGFNETVTLEEKGSKTVEVIIEELGEPTETGPITPPVETGPDEVKPTEGGSKVPGVVVLSLGIASGVMGAVFMGLRGGALSDLDEMCGGDETCPPSAEDTADKGKLYTGLAEVTIGLGAVGVIAGIVMIATSGGGSSTTQESTSEETTTSKKRGRFVGVSAGAKGADVGGLSLVGRF